jgi:hypothetical protein
MEDKRKHLEFIQGIINRHNSNSFLIKGWTITVAAALYALAGTINEPFLVLLALVPIFMFWGLDAFYLSNERCFVDLYNSVAKGSYNLPNQEVYKEDFIENSSTNETGSIADFNMNFKKFEIWKDNSWWTVIKSKTILSFYLSLLIVTIIISILFYIFNNGKSETIEVETTIKSSELQLKLESEPPTIINNIYPLEKSTDTLSTNNPLKK